jgi:hypothetical protein
VRLGVESEVLLVDIGENDGFAYFSLMPPPTPLPFPCTDKVASVKLHEEAAMAELVTESSSACDITESRCILRVMSGKNDFDGDIGLVEDSQDVHNTTAQAGTSTSSIEGGANSFWLVDSRIRWQEQRLVLFLSTRNLQVPCNPTVLCTATRRMTEL